MSFFGDSQGMTLLINKPNGLDGLITTSDSTVEGCGVLLGTIQSKVGFSRDLDQDCGNWPVALARARRSSTDRRSRWSNSAPGTSSTTRSTANSSTFGSPGWDAYFEQQLAKGIGCSSTPARRSPWSACPCYRPIAAGGLPLLPERGYDDRTRHVTTLLRAPRRRRSARVFMSIRRSSSATARSRRT